MYNIFSNVKKNVEKRFRSGKVYLNLILIKTIHDQKYWKSINYCDTIPQITPCNEATI